MILAPYARFQVVALCCVFVTYHTHNNPNEKNASVFYICNTPNSSLLVCVFGFWKDIQFRQGIHEWSKAVFRMCFQTFSHPQPPMTRFFIVFKN